MKETDFVFMAVVVFGVVLLTAGILCAVSFLAMVLWNEVAPVFGGPYLSYYHTICCICLIFLVRSLFWPISVKK